MKHIRPNIMASAYATMAVIIFGRYLKLLDIIFFISAFSCFKIAEKRIVSAVFAIATLISAIIIIINGDCEFSLFLRILSRMITGSSVILAIIIIFFKLK